MWPTYVERVLPPLFTFQADKRNTKTTSANTVPNTRRVKVGAVTASLGRLAAEQGRVSSEPLTELCAAEPSCSSETSGDAGGLLGCEAEEQHSAHRQARPARVKASVSCADRCAFDSAAQQRRQLFTSFAMIIGHIFPFISYQLYLAVGGGRRGVGAAGHVGGGHVQ